MKKYMFLLFTLSFLNVFSQYKYPKKDNAEIVLQSTLAIQLLEEKTEFDTYANNAIKDIFTENWKLTEVVFLSKEEINKLKKSKESKYAYLTCDDGLQKDMRSRHISKEGKMYSGIATAPTGAIKQYYAAFTFSFFSYDLEIIKKGKLASVTRIGFANGELSKIDYLFLCQQLSSLIDNSHKDVRSKDYYSVEKNIEQIKNSKLILLKDFFKEKDIKKMESFYKNEYELVDREKYQNIILNKENGNNYVKIIWSHQHKMYLWIIVDAQNGSVISQMGFGGVHFGKNHDANDIIKAKHLKYITHKKFQKINNRYK